MAENLDGSQAKALNDLHGFRHYSESNRDSLKD